MPYAWALSDLYMCLQASSCFIFGRGESVSFFLLLLLLVGNLVEVTFPVCWTVATNFVVISLFAGTRRAGCSMCACRVSWVVETSLQLNEERTVVGYCGKTA